MIQKSATFCYFVKKSNLSLYLFIFSFLKQQTNKQKGLKCLIVSVMNPSGSPQRSYQNKQFRDVRP